MFHENSNLPIYFTIHYENGKSKLKVMLSHILEEYYYDKNLSN